MARQSTIYLFNCYFLDVNHNHTVNFNNINSQYNFFMNHLQYTIEECTYLRKERVLKVGKYIDDLQWCNYCAFKNGSTGKMEYYFITSKSYVSENLTDLTIKLDVIQTYLFDMNLSRESLVDRSHLWRWTQDGKVASYNMQQVEDIEVGEYQIHSRETIYNYANNGGYIVTSTTKLSSDNGGSGSGSGSGSLDNWKNGLVSEDGFVLIKSMEGFSATPYNLGDGTYTIGYGTTSEYDPEHYNQLAPECTEEQASNVFADSIDNNYAAQVLSKLKASGKDLSTVKQCEFDAWVSFCYNHGSFWDHDIWTMYVNGSSAESVAERWKTTVIMEGSAFEQGLRDRRSREADAFLGTYRPKQIENLNGGYVTDNNGKGYVPERYIYTEPDISAIRQGIVASAKKLLGKPYVFGGNYPPLGSDSGTDCSGLCQWAYNDNGIKISRTTYTQIKEGKLVTQSQAKPGDLVFTRGYGDNGHVVMFLSNNDDGSIHVIEAKQTGTNIMYNDRTVDGQYMFRNLLGD